MKRVTVKGKKWYYFHPWIYAKSLVDDGEASPGECVEVYTTRGQFLGSAFFNPHSKIVLRFYSREKREFDYHFVRNKLERALEWRRSLYPGENSFRVLFGESDGVPGLVVDKYGDGLVIQVLSYGVERHKKDVIYALQDLFSPSFIFEKGDSSLRAEEGLPLADRLHHGEIPESLEIEVSGLKYLVDIAGGQKTGFYFDQRENRERVVSLVKGTKALDIFSYTGGFTLHLLKAGFSRVYAVDRSKSALSLLMKNVELNSFERERVVPIEKEAFQFLDEMLLSGMKFDVIVLDPPSFARKKGQVEEAINGFKVLHDRAIRLLEPGGYIVTFSCSHYISGEALLESFTVPAMNLRRHFVLLERLGQAKDHPVLLGFRESEYLKGFVLKETT